MANNTFRVYVKIKTMKKIFATIIFWFYKRNPNYWKMRLEDLEDFMQKIIRRQS